MISLDAGYRGDAEDFRPERQLIRRLLYSPTGLSTFFLGVVVYTIGLLSKKTRPCSHFSLLGSVPIFPKTLLYPQT